MKTTKKILSLMAFFFLSMALFQGCDRSSDADNSTPAAYKGAPPSAERKSSGTVRRIGKISELNPPGNDGSKNGSGKIIEDGAKNKFYVFQTPADVAGQLPLSVGLAVVFDNPNGNQAGAINISSPPPAPNAEITDFTLSAAGNNINISWTTTAEVGVGIYLLDRKLNGAATYDEGVLVTFPTGVGAQHTMTDTPPTKGTYSYRLRASLSDGTSKVLGEGTVTL